jgi:hypothetical protein
MIGFIPNRGVRTGHYVPPPYEIPEGKVFALAFSFPATGPLLNADWSEAVKRPFLVTHIVANTTAAAGSFLLQIYHQHGSEQRQLFPKAMQQELVAGSARSPLMLKSPYYIAAGDSITAVVSNLGKDLAGADAQADIQVVLWGVSL